MNKNCYHPEFKNTVGKFFLIFFIIFVKSFQSSSFNFIELEKFCQTLIFNLANAEQL